MPDKDGIPGNTVLGYDTLEEYQNDEAFFGAVIGRVGGRIKNAELALDGHTYNFSENDGNNHIHGGPNGFHRAHWDSFAEIGSDEVRITFSYVSTHGEEGFPGRLITEVIYTINEANELIISYRAESDKKTMVNLTNHSYFSLSGNLDRIALNHELTMDSDSFVELDNSLLPTGNIIPVENSVFDFRNGRKISEGINSQHPQIEIVGGGYNHLFLLKGESVSKMSLADRESGPSQGSGDRPSRSHSLFRQ